MQNTHQTKNAESVMGTERWQRGRLLQFTFRLLIQGTDKKPASVGYHQVKHNLLGVVVLSTATAKALFYFTVQSVKGATKMWNAAANGWQGCTLIHFTFSFGKRNFKDKSLKVLSDLAHILESRPRFVSSFVWEEVFIDENSSKTLRQLCNTHSWPLPLLWNELFLHLP